MSGGKLFETLRAKAARAGVQVVRSDPQDGRVRVFAIQRGVIREIQTIDDLEALVNHLQGR